MAEGLLHLGAMAVLTGVVYLNLDKAVYQPQEVADLTETLRQKVRNWAQGCDPEYSYTPKGKKKPRPSRTYDSGVGYFLLKFGKVPAVKHFPWYQRLFYGTFNLIAHPTSSIICDGIHYAIVAILTAFSAACFFGQVSGPVYGLSWHLIGDRLLYPVYLATVVLSLAFATLSRRVPVLEVQLDIMMADIDREKKHEEDKVRRRMQSETTKSAASVSPGE